ncbi:MAG: hypothetical protein JST53_14085, partial [Actinobacteria bacterium]|nr:hypothetical protein [Actinomycetota bacterium]
MDTRLHGPAKRIAIAITALVVLVALAVGIAIWRYGVAEDAHKEALTVAQAQFYAQQVRTTITDEGGTADAYGGDGDPADLSALSAIKAEFRQALESLHNSGGLDAGDSTIVEQIEARQGQLEKTFHDKVKPVAGTPNFDEGVKPYEAQVETLENQIDAFDRSLAARAQDASTHADSTASAARTVAIIAGLLAILLAVGLGIYVVRLVDRLVDRISAAASMLAPMAREMEAAIAETATATSEQSSAVAEAAATAEELTATATSIADNAKAGSAAAEQTGEL